MVWQDVEANACEVACALAANNRAKAAVATSSKSCVFIVQVSEPADHEPPSEPRNAATQNVGYFCWAVNSHGRVTTKSPIMPLVAMKL